SQRAACRVRSFVECAQHAALRVKKATFSRRMFPIPITSSFAPLGILGCRSVREFRLPGPGPLLKLGSARTEGFPPTGMRNILEFGRIAVFARNAMGRTGAGIQRDLYASIAVGASRETGAGSGQTARRGRFRET